MTDNRKQKRAIRERMSRTGEPYTLARRRHLAELIRSDMPDARCITLPDGSCTAEQCMHTEESK